MKTLRIFSLALLTMLLLNCSSDDEPTTYNVEMRVESTGDFKVWWNYTNNPDADADWLTHPAVLHGQYFSREFPLQREDFYAIRVEPVDSTEYTVTILVNGEIEEQRTSNDYTLIDRSFYP